MKVAQNIDMNNATPISTAPCLTNGTISCSSTAPRHLWHKGIVVRALRDEAFSRGTANASYEGLRRAKQLIFDAQARQGVLTQSTKATVPPTVSRRLARFSTSDSASRKQTRL